MALVSNNMNMVPQTSLPQLRQALAQQAQPQPLQPQGYRNMAANAQLGLLRELMPGGGQFEQYRQDELQKFQNQVLPQIAGQLRGRGLGAFQQGTSDALQNLGERLGTQRLGFEQQRQGQLGQFLGQQQQLGQRQQEIGLQGLQNIAGLQQQLAQAPLSLQLQFLQALINARSRQAAQGLGQGGDTAIDQGAIQPILQALVQGLGTYAKMGA